MNADEYFKQQYLEYPEEDDGRKMVVFNFYDLINFAERYYQHRFLKVFGWRDMTAKDHEWAKQSGLYGDWIDSGKKLSFDLYKEKRRSLFYDEKPQKEE